MKVIGRCFCGKISSQARVADNIMVACYCMVCQVFSGAPYRAVVIAHADTVIIDEDVNEFVKTTESRNHGCGDGNEKF